MHRFIMKNNSFTDSISINVDAALIETMVVGQSLETAECIANRDNLGWKLRCFPAGIVSDPNKVYVEFLLNNAPYNVLGTFSIRGTNIKEKIDRTFNSKTDVYRGAIISHADLLASNAIINGVFVLRCDVVFKAPAVVESQNLAPSTATPLVAHSFVAVSEHNAVDVELLIGDRRLHAHRGFLSLISPVFHAMFSHDTKEAQSGVVFIEDFQFEAVEDAINFCYGRPLEKKDAFEVIEALKFVDKYSIKAATIALENWLVENCNDDNFCAIAKYAWDHSCDKLQEKCAEFYIQDTARFAMKPEFITLDATTLSGLIQKAPSFADEEEEEA